MPTNDDLDIVYGLNNFTFYARDFIFYSRDIINIFDDLYIQTSIKNTNKFNTWL